MTDGRTIRWKGFFNARDLGGLPVAGGRMTRFGAFVLTNTTMFTTSQAPRAEPETPPPCDGSRLSRRDPPDSVGADGAVSVEGDAPDLLTG